MNDLPPIVAVTGKKKSGKGFFCNRLARDMHYDRIHIAASWLRKWFLDHGIEEITDELKATYRKEIQADAQAARDKDPLVLIRPMVKYLWEYFSVNPNRRIAIDGIRFINEVEALRCCGACIVRIEVSDEARRARFHEIGEDFALFYDGFEREIDLIEPDMVLSGMMSPGSIAPVFQSYSSYWMKTYHVDLINRAMRNMSESTGMVE